MLTRFLSLYPIIAVIFISACLAAPNSANAQFYDLEISLPSLEIPESDLIDTIPVYMSNFNDTVAGFEFVLNTDRPDLVHLDNYSLITNGTLTSDWESVGAQYIAGYGLVVSGLANWINPPEYTPGIGYPQYGNIPLVILQVGLGYLPDTVTSAEASLEFVYELEDFNFVNEKGQSLIYGTDTTYDTLYFNCLEWVYEAGDTMCLDSQEVSAPPADIMVIDTILNGYFDTTKFSAENGSIRVISLITCGDINYDLDVNLLDIMYLINYLYQEGPPPPKPAAADVNSDGYINLHDITYMVNYLYKDGPPPECLLL